ncbi:tigger transposable element-derived protein 6 isoform X2 [Leptinotarsa decemlineata]|uniref:tigger transposable element-derived protein 6 isoform X2 n=1 Tax=Leptinotarsa decemlineata TaxID=7539 RepID=UPI003D309A37
MRNAAKLMGIPFSSLQKRIKKGSTLGPHLGWFTVCRAETEAELANLVKKMANIFYGCTAKQIRKVAFEYAEKLNLKHNFNQSSKMVGRDWLHAFMTRHNISIRKPEATSINRIIAFNKTKISLFFELLGQLMEKHRFVPKNIYNSDEMGISTVQIPGKILATKEQKRVGSITSWERGKNITLICAMTSAGGYIPPMFIFPRKRLTPLLEKDGPAGALYKCSDNGWINENLFIEWLVHFKQHAKPSADEPILLILDKYASHISLFIYKYCKYNHIHMLSLPPHTSHRMQPLDVSFFGPLKMAYKKECDLFLKSHLAEKITPYDAALLDEEIAIGIQGKEEEILKKILKIASHHRKRDQRDNQEKNRGMKQKLSISNL